MKAELILSAKDKSEGSALFKVKARGKRVLLSKVSRISDFCVNFLFLKYVHVSEDRTMRVLSCNASLLRVHT